MKMTTLRLIPSIAVAASVLVIAPTTTFAKGESRASFEEIDTNSDGEITTAELAAYAATRFSDADTNGDGNLSADELQASMATRNAERAERRIERMIERRDANDDGVLSAEEMAPSEDRIAKRFERLDRNDDGTLSAEEFEAASKHRGGREGRGGKRGN